MLRRIVERAVDIARKWGAVMCIDVHTLGGSGSVRDSDSDVVRDLHVSLTGPFFLHAHQREEIQMSKARHEERDEDVDAWQPRTTRSMGERERAHREGLPRARCTDGSIRIYIVLLKYTTVLL